MRMLLALTLRKRKDNSSEIPTTTSTSIALIPRHSPNSPIQCLDFDLLWYIVSMNANMFDDDRALETTLATSRVCRVWRAFMLSMPSIWAHLIDLDNLHWRTAEFRREMIRRSGTVFLWVKARGCVDLDSPARYMKQVLNTLEENWNRIERLDANILIEHVGLEQWATLCRPTPHLASLNLTFIEHPMQYMKRPILSLLGGAAPMVRRSYGVMQPNLQLHALTASYLGTQRCAYDRRSS